MKKRELDRINTRQKAFTCIMVPLMVSVSQNRELLISTYEARAIHISLRRASGSTQRIYACEYEEGEKGLAEKNL